MEPVLSSNGQPALASASMKLGPVFPVINGTAFLDAVPQVQQDGQCWVCEYALNQPDFQSFLLEIEPAAPGELRLRYTLRGAKPGPWLNRFGIGFRAVENLRQYLRHGYHSWDGSYYVDPEALTSWGADEPRPETSYGMTQLLPRSGAGTLVLGFERHERFQQSFTFDTRTFPTGLKIETWWDQKEPEAGECRSEWLICFEHPEVEEALREWARRVAQAAQPAPRPVPAITGWCSWYNLYNYITEENILEHLAGVKSSGLPLRVFQLDDGFTPEMGDWLEVKPTFPRGIQPLLADIRTAGYIPGLWIAPFLVGNRSHLYRDHPDWVLRERATGQPLAHMHFYGEFRWGKRSEETYVLDTTHPAALEYLRQVFHAWRWEWGCEYFKTDFMFAGCAYGPEQVLRHTPGLTRVEIWRQVAESIRTEIGDALWTGCGSPLWPAVGLVDGMRIGRDVGVEWRGSQSAQSLLRDQAGRNFTNHIFWQVDPDCLLLRERFHSLSEIELRSLALYAGMAGGLLLTSDALDELSPARLGLWKMLLEWQPGVCSYPLLGQSEVISWPGRGAAAHELAALDPVSVQVRGEVSPGRSAIFVFNTGDAPVERRYELAALGLPAGMQISEWPAGENLGALDTLWVRLALHEGRLFFAQV